MTRKSATKGRRHQVARRRRLSPEEKVAQTEAREKQRIVRERALLESGVRKVEILATLKDEGVDLSHTTVTNVVAGTSRNADVERVFCKLTRTSRADMFPDEQGQ